MTTILPLQLLVAPDRNDPAPLVLYHGKGCPDGFAAALAAWMFYDGQVQCLGLDHGDVQSLADLPALQGRAVYVLDFSFSAELLRAIEEQAAKLVLLDHHKSAADSLAGYTCRCGVVFFDMHKSGAYLAWEFFHPNAPVPDLVRYVQDRDLWNWQYPDSAAYLAALDMEPQDFARWQAVLEFDAPQQAAFMARGQAMDEKFRHLAAEMAEDARPITFNGEQGLMLNAPSAFHSLLGDLLSRKSGTFALLWTVNRKGLVKVGLRSQRGYNCIALAQSMGGGGHAQACGFRMPADRLPELLGGALVA